MRVVFVDGGDDGHLVDHFEIEAAVDEGVGFLGVVGQQADLGQAEVLEDLDADAVVAGVGLVAEGQVGFDGVEPFVLQVVGLDLFDQSDAAALLGQVDQHAALPRG